MSDSPGILCVQFSKIFSLSSVVSRFLSVTGIFNPSQLLQFIVSADEINFVHMDIKMTNMFVVQSQNLEMAKLAVGDFGSSQRGEEQVRNPAG